MRKGDAKEAFETMFNEWEKELGTTITAESDPSFAQFSRWAHEKGYSHYLNFRSRIGAREDVENWFISRFKQRWRY